MADEQSRQRGDPGELYGAAAGAHARHQIEQYADAVGLGLENLAKLLDLVNADRGRLRPVPAANLDAARSFVDNFRAEDLRKALRDYAVLLEAETARTQAATKGTGK